MSHTPKKSPNSLQNIIKFLLNANIDNSVEILELQVLIQDNIKLKKKDRKKLNKKMDKLIDKVSKNVELLKRMSQIDEAK